MKKFPVAASFLLALALVGCSTSTEVAANSESSGSPAQGDEITTTVDPTLIQLLPTEIVEKGHIDIAMDLPAPPMATYDENSREIGFDPELARLLGQKLGLEVAINKQAFDTTIASLQAHQNDVIMSGMNDTPERQQTLTFVDYLYAGFAIAVQPGNPEHIASQQDLCGHTVAVQKGTAQGEVLRGMNCGINLMQLPSEPDAQTALRSGKAQAYVVDAAVAEYAAANVGDGHALEIVRDPNNPAGFNTLHTGIGILKEDKQLAEALRKTLQSLIDEGTYKKVLDRNKLGSYAVDSALIDGKAVTS